MIYESGHPFSRDSLGRFAAGTANREERRAIVRHLLADCPECRRVVLQIFQGGGAVSSQEYQRAITKAFERAVAAVGATCPLPPANSLLAELDRQPPLRRETLVRNHPRYRSTELLNLLARRSFSLRFGDYESMLTDARVAICLAQTLDANPLELDVARQSEAKVRAWFYYANALRIVGRHDEAAAGFEQALLHLREGGCAKEVEAETFEHLATLRTAERHFEAADSLLQRSAATYRESRNRDKLGRILLKQAINLIYACQPVEALTILLEATSLIDARAEPNLAICAVEAAVRCYLDDNKPEQALNVFLLARDLFQVQDQPLVLAKIWWTEGQLLMAHGHLEAARKLFERVHQEYASKKLHYCSSLVALDLALVLTQLGLFADVRALISRTLPVFHSLRVRRELLASIILLTQADRQGSYVAIIRETVRRLEREPGALDLQAVS